MTLPDIRELQNKIEALEREHKSLQQRSDRLERASEQNEARCLSIEQELNDLATLYVATFQLSATLSVRRVVRHMCELLEQLMGAEAFVLYALSADAKTALPIGSRGVAPSQLAPASAEHGPIGDVCLTGVARIVSPDARKDPNEPLAVMPLVFDTEVVGVISVWQLLPHKQAWEPVDHELFKLLGAHGASALIAANLYEREKSVRSALRDVQEHVGEHVSIPVRAAAHAKTGD